MGVSVRTRLMGLCGLGVVSLGLVVGTMAWNSALGKRQVAELLASSQAVRNHTLADMLHDAIRADVLSAVLASSPEAREDAAKELKEHAEEFLKLSGETANMVDAPAVKAMVTALKPKHADYVERARAVLSAKLTPTDMGAPTMASFLAAFHDVEKANDDAGDALAKNSEDVRAQYDASSEFFTQVLIVIGIAGTVAPAIAAWLLSRSIASPLSKHAATLGRVSQGDLTLRLDESGPTELATLGAAANRLIGNLSEVIGELAGASDAVSSTARDLSEGNRTLSDQAGTLQSRVEQMTAAMEEMSSSVTSVATRATSVSDQAGLAGESARKGGEVVAASIESMRRIESTVGRGRGLIEQLGDRTREIGTIVEMIEDIADQTNLLALNAAIEAARAGEHGRGFAVVAEEVRKLADRTAKATEQISTSIREVTEQTSAAVGQMQSSADEVRQGVERASAADGSLREIVGQTSEVAKLVNEIAGAAGEQKSATDSVAGVITQISEDSRRSTDAIAHASAQADQLRTRAEQLREVVSRFKLTP